MKIAFKEMAKKKKWGWPPIAEDFRRWVNSVSPGGDTAALFVVQLGTGTTSPGEDAPPPWNVADYKDLESIEKLAFCIVAPDGVVAIAHSGSITSSVSIYDSFPKDSVWSTSESFTIVHDHPRYRKGVKTVSAHSIHLLAFLSGFWLKLCYLQTEFQDAYTKLEIFRRGGKSLGFPRDTSVDPISFDLDMVSKRMISNCTRSMCGSKGDHDFSGTLSPAALQCIMEYTTLPGDIVFTLNAQFGAIFDAAENCGRLVYGSEAFPHFGNEAFNRIQHHLQSVESPGSIVPHVVSVLTPDT